MPYENYRRQAPGYECPACGERVHKDRGHFYHLGPYVAHEECRTDCTLCGQEIPPPAIGQRHSITAFLGRPVHGDCRRTRLAEDLG